MKAQVAFEYLVIVGIVVTFLIPVWAYISAVNEQTTQSLYISQVQTAANKITSAANLVYTQGPPAQITSEVFIPRGVVNATFINTTVKFSVIIGKGTTDVTSTSIGSLNGSLPTSEGLYIFTIKAIGNYVNISY